MYVEWQLQMTNLFTFVFKPIDPPWLSSFTSGNIWYQHHLIVIFFIIIIPLCFWISIIWFHFSFVRFVSWPYPWAHEQCWGKVKEKWVENKIRQEKGLNTLGELKGSILEILGWIPILGVRNPKVFQNEGWESNW